MVLVVTDVMVNGFVLFISHTRSMRLVLLSSSMKDLTERPQSMLYLISESQCVRKSTHFSSKCYLHSGKIHQFRYELVVDLLPRIANVLPIYPVKQETNFVWMSTVVNDLMNWQYFVVWVAPTSFLLPLPLCQLEWPRYMLGVSHYWVQCTMLESFKMACTL